MVDNNINKRFNIDEKKEEFCTACAITPLAFAGLGASAYGSSRGSNKKMKKMLVWGGVLSVVVTLIIAYYYWRTCSDCQ